MKNSYAQIDFCSNTALYHNLVHLTATADSRSQLTIFKARKDGTAHCSSVICLGCSAFQMWFEIWHLIIYFLKHAGINNCQPNIVPKTNGTNGMSGGSIVSTPLFITILLWPRFDSCGHHMLFALLSVLHLSSSRSLSIRN